MRESPSERANQAAGLPYCYYSISSFVLLFVNVYVRSRALTDRVDVTSASANDSGNYS